jgi:hypothetical protein
VTGAEDFGAGQIAVVKIGFHAFVTRIVSILRPYIDRGVGQRGLGYSHATMPVYPARARMIRDRHPRNSLVRSCVAPLIRLAFAEKKPQAFSQTECSQHRCFDYQSVLKGMMQTEHAPVAVAVSEDKEVQPD